MPDGTEEAALVQGPPVLCGGVEHDVAHGAQYVRGHFLSIAVSVFECAHVWLFLVSDCVDDCVVDHGRQESVGDRDSLGEGVCS